jgi:alpha-glucoside transport system permease protein
MVIPSAALKGVPTDVIEAARMDGASELNIFFRVIVPMISPTIAVVATTMVINVLKIRHRLRHDWRQFQHQRRGV